MTAAGIFFVALAAVCCVYFGYPALLLLLAVLRPRPVRRGAFRPRISVIIAAHNEEAVIARKIGDTLANGYPADRLEIVVASDGSTDGTEEIVRRSHHPCVRLLTLPRAGKLAALNAAVAASSGEVLVFTDADVLLEPGSLSRLLENLADPSVGGVTGRKAQAGGGGAGRGLGGGERLYARYDEWQKRLAGRIGSTTASHGALHAIRRELYRPADDGTAADDLAISTRVVLQGYRLAYEAEAVAWVTPPADGAGEFRRKVRIANQVMRALFGLERALWTSGFYSVQLLFHKLLRYLIPVFLLVLLAANAALALGPVLPWRFLLAAQLLFYGLAAAGWLLQRTRFGSWPVVSVPYYFCLVNTAALVALASMMRGERAAFWVPRAGFHLRRNMVDRTASLCLAGWLAASAATAQAPQGAEALRRDRERSLFELEFRVTGSYIYNFLQAPKELPGLNVPAGNGELRVTLPLADRRTRVFLRAGGSLYHELAPSAALAGGGSWTAGPRRLDAIAGFRWRNPRIEGGDQVGSADLVYFSGSYSVRPVPQLELSGLVDYYRATYSSLTSRNHHAFDAGGAVRYRGLGYQFMPEAGAALGRLDARVDSEDYEQDTFWIGASSIPVVGTYFSTRYRHRRRRYPVLGREDTRHQLTITAELGLASRWSWLLYSSFEDARSSNADRTFTTQLIVTGLAYRF